jgi:hypothetical protein
MFPMFVAYCSSRCAVTALLLPPQARAAVRKKMGGGALLGAQVAAVKRLP